MQERKGFIAAMFDFSFSEFITTRLLAFIFGLMILGSVFGAFSVAAAVGAMLGRIIGFLVFPIAFLFFVAVARVYMEVVVVMFKIAEHTRETARNTAVAAAPEHSTAGF